MATENRPEEIAELHKRALQMLEHCEESPPYEPIQGFRPTLRIWHYPALSPYAVWMLFQPDPGSVRKQQWHVREVIWDRPHDMSRFAHPLEGVRQGFLSPPTINVRDAGAPNGLISDSLRQIARLPIPVVGVEGPIGLDGDMSGIETYDPFLRVRLEWWWEGPRAWKTFIQAVVRLREVLLHSFE